MRKRFWIGYLVLLLAGFAHGQHCDVTVSDEAGVFGGKLDSVMDAADSLNKESLNVRVVTLDAIPGGTLEAWESNMIRTCPSWQSTNRVVFVVSPSRHKLGLFYGNELKPVLDGSAAAIKSQFMGPAFASKDYARGMIQGIQQVSTRQKAFNDAALHPEQKTTVVNNQASDNSGFVHVLGWIVGIGGLVTILILLGRWARKREDDKDEVFASKQEASNTAASVSDLIRKLRKTYEEQAALGTNVASKQRMVDLVSEEYSDMAGKETYNPDTPGLSVAGYKAITKAYQRLMDELNTIERPSYRQSTPAPSSYPKSRRASQHIPNYPTSGTPAPAPSTPASATNNTVVHNTYVDNSNFGGGYGYGGIVPVPVIIEDDRPVYREPDPPAREPDPEPAYSSRYSSRDDSGSSSSWSSSDSSSDSGSSSSYDSGSSSSDSGSSSDF